MTKPNRTERADGDAVKNLLRATASYSQEETFLQNATVARVRARLVAGPAGAAWVGDARVVSGKRSRTVIGNPRLGLRGVGPNAGLWPTSRAPCSYGLDPEQLITPNFAEEAAKQVTVVTGLSVARLAGFAERMLLRECAQDLGRLRDVIDQHLLDPVMRAAAEDVFESKSKVSRQRLRQERLDKFLSTYLPRAVVDGIEEQELIDAFRLAVAKQVTES